MDKETYSFMYPSGITSFSFRFSDDCDYVQTATESYYLVDTDNPDRDLRVTPDGQVTQAW